MFSGSKKNDWMTCGGFTIFANDIFLSSTHKEIAGFPLV